MKLQSKKQKSQKLLIVALVAVILIAVIVGAVFLVKDVILPQQSTSDHKMVINKLPKTTYYIGEKFDPSGMIVKISGDDVDDYYYVEVSQLTFTGFDSSVASEEIVVTAHYKEFSKSFTVEIIEYPDETVTLQSIRLSQELEYSLKYWNRFGPELEGVMLICTYSDGSEVEVPMSSQYCFGLDLNLKSAGTTQFTVRYTNENGETAETVVTVTITE